MARNFLKVLVSYLNHGTSYLSITNYTTSNLVPLSKRPYHSLGNIKFSTNAVTQDFLMLCCFNITLSFKIKKGRKFTFSFYCIEFDDITDCNIYKKKSGKHLIGLEPNLKVQRNIFSSS